MEVRALDACTRRRRESYDTPGHPLKCVVVPACLPVPGQVTCPLCPVKSASALTLTMLKALGQGDHTAVVLTGIKK